MENAKSFRNLEGKKRLLTGEKTSTFTMNHLTLDIASRDRAVII
jgi:hypothetical protein